MLALSIFLASCSTNSIKKDGILYGEVVGDLYHTQYWDANDKWDLKNLNLRLYFDDGSTQDISALDSNAHYTFYPESPNGLSHDTTSFSIISGYYVDKNNEKHEILPRQFDGITIVSNPNPDHEKMENSISNFIFIGSIILIGLLGYFSLRIIYKCKVNK